LRLRVPDVTPRAVALEDAPLRLHNRNSNPLPAALDAVADALRITRVIGARCEWPRHD
jgi:hypothetical protein